MPQPLSEYFALEAGEYLDQLDALLKPGDAPDAAQFFRLARGVRGSAQIAGASGIALVAERMEDGARALRDGPLAWSEELRQRSVRTIDDIRVLVRAHPRWGDAEQTRARDAAALWGDADGERRPSSVAAGGDQLFAFVRREITGVVAELDRVTAELAEAPTAREPLRAVLRRMRPVRGVAGMPALAPVLEVLEGIEDAVHEVLARSLSVDGGYLDLLVAARDALDGAGFALERGEAPTASGELERFRDLREQTGGAGDEETEAGVIPVSELFYADAGPHILSSPLAPVAPADAETATAEVDSFLRIEATGFLDRAESLVAELPSKPKRRFARITAQLADLATSVRELAGTYGLTQTASAAEDAAKRLRKSKNAEEARDALADLRASLPGAAPRPPKTADASTETAPGDAGSGDGKQADSGDSKSADAGTSTVIPVVPDEDGVVPIEALLYDGEAALREALALRARIDALMGAAARPGAPLGDTLDELFGLVELGLHAKRAS
ncbi:MAG TPA: Hpt domain-containing protein [Longimicrobiaceae bacterium]|jgi:chemotaxis protein histidine kinase CheA|nr:Hpt domain-containing protein [Longimicrobiaceae bacterium]